MRRASRLSGWRPYIAMLIAVLTLGGCASTPQSAAPVSPLPVRWSVNALQFDRLSEIDAEMSKPFEDPVPVRRGKDEAIVPHCSTCLELLARHSEPPL